MTMGNNLSYRTYAYLYLISKGYTRAKQIAPILGIKNTLVVQALRRMKLLKLLEWNGIHKYCYRQYKISNQGEFVLQEMPPKHRIKILLLKTKIFIYTNNIFVSNEARPAMAKVSHSNTHH